LVFDYCEFDLFGLLYVRGPALLTTLQVVSYVRQLLEALKVCHENGIIHRDLKPSNLFIDRNNTLRLGDFGLARKIAQSSGVKYSTNVTTLFYRAPEILMESTLYGCEVDMWSVGCIIYELMSKRPLFHASAGHSNQDQYIAISKICGDPNPDEWPELATLPGRELLKPSQPKPNRLKEHLENTLPLEYQESIDLLLQIVRWTPSKRISAKEAAIHPFLVKFGSELAPDNLPAISSHEELHQLGVSTDMRGSRAKYIQRSTLLPEPLTPHSPI
jgi:serine/threonine protein kinase